MSEDIVIQEINNTVVIEEVINRVTITAPGPQGAPGEQGPPGSIEVTGTSGEAITSFCLLVLINGLLYKADPENISHVGKVVGISITSASIGQQITYIQTGKINSITVTNGARYYAGANGSLSTSPTYLAAVWQKSLGVAEGTDALVVVLQSELVKA